MIHPNTELRFINDIIGYGVVATKFIPKGTITWALDKLDRTFKPKEVKAMEPMYQETLDKYCYRNNKGELVLCWDISRFVNHSFNSNCISTAYDFEIAVRDIHPGEELTDDYGYLNVLEPFECIQENGCDRTTVYSDDLLKYHPVWDAKLIESFKNFDQIEQPLKNILSQETWMLSEKIAKGNAKMDSILNCYYKPKSKKHSNSILSK